MGKHIIEYTNAADFKQQIEDLHGLLVGKVEPVVNQPSVENEEVPAVEVEQKTKTTTRKRNTHAQKQIQEKAKPAEEVKEAETPADDVQPPIDTRSVSTDKAMAETISVETEPFVPEPEPFVPESGEKVPPIENQTDISDFIPLTKEERDIMYARVKEWLFEGKKPVKANQNKERSANLLQFLKPFCIQRVQELPDDGLRTLVSVIDAEEGK